MKTMKHILLVLALIAGFAAPLLAQTTPAETTTTAAVTATQQTIPLTSVTTTPTTAWVAGNFLWIDTEAMQIRSISGLTAVVIRGALNTTGSAHKSGAVVYAAFPGHFFSSTAGGPPGPPQGGGSGDGLACTRTQWSFLPQIDTVYGNVWSCPKGTAQSWNGANVMPVTFNSMTTVPF